MYLRRCSKNSEKDSKTILISKTNYDGPIQIFTDTDSGEFIDQTQNVNAKYISVRLIITLD